MRRFLLWKKSASEPAAGHTDDRAAEKSSHAVVDAAADGRASRAKAKQLRLTTGGGGGADGAPHDAAPSTRAVAAPTSNRSSVVMLSVSDNESEETKFSSDDDAPGVTDRHGAAWSSASPASSDAAPPPVAAPAVEPASTHCDACARLQRQVTEMQAERRATSKLLAQLRAELIRLQTATPDDAAAADAVNPVAALETELSLTKVQLASMSWELECRVRGRSRRGFKVAADSVACVNVRCSRPWLRVCVCVRASCVQLASQKARYDTEVDTLRTQLQERTQERDRAVSLRDNLQSKLSEATCTASILRLENDHLRTENYRHRSARRMASGGSGAALLDACAADDAAATSTTLVGAVTLRSPPTRAPSAVVVPDAAAGLASASIEHAPHSGVDGDVPPRDRAVSGSGHAVTATLRRSFTENWNVELSRTLEELEPAVSAVVAGTATDAVPVPPAIVAAVAASTVPAAAVDIDAAAAAAAAAAPSAPSTPSPKLPRRLSASLGELSPPLGLLASTEKRKSDAGDDDGGTGSDGDEDTPAERRDKVGGLSLTPLVFDGAVSAASSVTDVHGTAPHAVDISHALAARTATLHSRGHRRSDSDPSTALKVRRRRSGAITLT
jgi:hypothetical protein